MPVYKDGREVGTGGSGAGLNWRGTWVASTVAAEFDAFEYQGAAYICTAADDGTGDAPDVSASFDLMAAKGAAGSQGPAGDTGPAGIAGDDGVVIPFASITNLGDWYAGTFPHQAVPGDCWFILDGGGLPRTFLNTLTREITGLEDPITDAGFIAVGDGIAGPSAYEIAVANGYGDTEEMWLASLKVLGAGETRLCFEWDGVQGWGVINPVTLTAAAAFGGSFSGWSVKINGSPVADQSGNAFPVTLSPGDVVTVEVGGMVYEQNVYITIAEEEPTV